MKKKINLLKKIKFPKIKYTFTINKKLKKILLYVVVLATLVALAFNFKSLLIAAMVNGKPISRISLDRQLEKQGGKQILENEIIKMLILGEAKKQKINITAQDVNNKIQEIENQVTSGGSSLDSILEAQGQTRESLKQQIQIQLIIENILGKDIQSTDQEIKDYFDKNKSLYAKDAKLETVKDKIKEDLRQQKIGEKFQPWLDELKKNSKIYYFLKL